MGTDCFREFVWFEERVGDEAGGELWVGPAGGFAGCPHLTEWVVHVACEDDWFRSGEPVCRIVCGWFEDPDGESRRGFGAGGEPVEGEVDAGLAVEVAPCGGIPWDGVFDEIDGVGERCEGGPVAGGAAAIEVETDAQTGGGGVPDGGGKRGIAGAGLEFDVGEAEAGEGREVGGCEQGGVAGRYGEAREERAVGVAGCGVCGHALD